MQGGALMVALWVAAGCARPASDACNDGTFCPPNTTCGAHDVCFVEVGGCGQFDDRMPCLVDPLTSGFCLAGTCQVGLEVLGFNVRIPQNDGLTGVEVRLRDHPEVLPLLTNVNGYFGLHTPHDIEGIVEMTYPDAYISQTRPVVIRDSAVLLDYLYGGIPIIPTAVATLFALQAGVELLPDRGIISGSSFDPTTNTEIAGVSVSLAAGSCDGPYYFDADGLPVLGATATIAGIGAFTFVNCELGETLVVATHASGTCRVLDDPAALGPVLVTVEPERAIYIGRVACGP